jgi:hypothetical protein
LTEVIFDQPFLVAVNAKPFISGIFPFAGDWLSLQAEK